MTEHTFTAVLTFDVDNLRDSEAALLEAQLLEFSSLSGRLEFPIGHFDKATASIEVESGSQDYHPREYKLLELSVVLPFSESDEKKELGRVFEKRIWDIVTIANLASPGILSPSEFMLRFDDSEFGIQIDVNPLYSRVNSFVLQNACNVANSLKWPLLQRRDFHSAWQWAIRQKGFLDGFSCSSVTRALNGFSQLIRQDLFRTEGYDNPEILFWALIGIEALYANGGGGFREQIREKSQALLGIQSTNKRKIGKMYDFRSLFIHGELDFLGPFSGSESKGKEDFADALGESTGLAIAILIATFQTLIQRGWSGLQFSYEVSDLAK